MFFNLVIVALSVVIRLTIHGGPIFGYADNTILPPCDSPVYCYGDLLYTVQMAEIFEDSKTFVDLRQKFSTNETLKRFAEFQSQNNGNATKAEISEFVNDTFEEGDELDHWDPTDWVENPAVLAKIKDNDIRNWASDLNKIWLNLGRKVKYDVKSNQEQYSLIYAPNGFIIPGGRFKEFYYWDTYWIIRGLLLCEMTTTVKGILENFLHFVDVFGFIPNGARIYYLGRSQPPLLIPMVNSYYEATYDAAFVRENFALLEKEYNFWMKNRTVDIEKNGKTYKMARYDVERSGPRPESYREDYNNAQFFTTFEDQLNFYINTQSAAESGWDFSTRWFIKDGANQGNLTDLSTVDIVPVDLNAFLCQNAEILSTMAGIIGDEEKGKFYQQEAQRWRQAVHDVFWNKDSGVWQDYETESNSYRDYFYPSNLAPLWTGCYIKEKTNSIASKVLSYLESTGALEYSGGIPTSMERSGEQWDFPNAWPPLQDIVIQGLYKLEVPKAQELALILAKNWLRTNYNGCKKTSKMFEKYNAMEPGKSGAGGEYIVQDGFGWTNGIIFEFLNLFGDEIELEDDDTEE